MKLYVNRRYSSSHAGPFKGGETIEVPDGLGEFLLRDGEGIFKVVGCEPVDTSPLDLSAMSTETATGLIVPDRRMRGGKVRKARK